MGHLITVSVPYEVDVMGLSELFILTRSNLIYL